MKNLKLTSTVIICLAITLGACKKEETEPKAPPADIIVTSQFKTNAEGWTVIGDAQGGFVEAFYADSGGISDGYIYGVDNVTGDYWYFNAPSAYLGDRSDFYGKTLSFSLYQESAMDNQIVKDDIVFSDGTNQIVYLLDSFPNPDWTNYSVKISEEGNWLYGDYTSSVMATADQIKGILSNVDKFWIRGEYQYGPDTGGLDNVEIK